MKNVDRLEKVADGLTKRGSTAPSIVFSGTTPMPTDVLPRLLGRIAQAKALTPAAGSWQSMLETDKTAAAQVKPVPSAVKPVLLAAYSTQLEVQAAFGAC